MPQGPDDTPREGEIVPTERLGALGDWLKGFGVEGVEFVENDVLLAE